jgi:hypothetical protein
MKNEKLHIDNAFREKLDGFSVQPPPQVWDNVQGQLAALKWKKRLVYLSWISAAAVVVLAFLAGWYFNAGVEITTPLAIEQQTIQGEIEGGIESEKNVLLENKDLNAVAELKQLEENLGEEGINADKSKSDNTMLVANIGVKKQNVTVSSADRFDIKGLRKIDADLNGKRPEVLLAKHSTPANEFILNETDRYLVAANATNIKSENSAETGWKMGVNISPGYSSYVSSHNENYSRNMTYSGDKGNGNVGGGFSVQYKTTKKLSVESGIYYAQSGQKSVNSFDLFAFRDRESDALFAPDNNYDYLSSASSVSPGFSNAINVNNGNIAMNSTAGVIEMAATPKGAQIASDFETAKYGFSDRLVSEGEFSQVFDFIEIPFYLRYSVVDSKLGIELVGGLNAGVVVGNNAYIDNNYGLQNIGKTQDISAVNFSGTVGVGVSYAMGKHFSLGVEPRLNYYLKSINSNPDINFRPYRIGVYTGVYYEF